MTDYPVHLYKLVSGECVVAEFISEDDINSRKNLRGHQVRNPFITNRFYELNPWLIGLDPTQNVLVIPMTSMMVMAEQDLIDQVLIDAYHDAVARHQRMNRLVE